MKKNLILVPLLVFLCSAAPLVEPADVLDDIAAGIRSGNAASLAQYFDNNVDITILDKESVYSKAQAQMVVKDFFQKYSVTSFTLIHRGTSAEGSLYGIGNLVTSSGVFRTYYFVKAKNGNHLLQELRFEKLK